MIPTFIKFISLVLILSLMWQTVAWAYPDPFSSLRALALDERVPKEKGGRLHSFLSVLTKVMLVAVPLILLLFVNHQLAESQYQHARTIELQWAQARGIPYSMPATLAEFGREGYLSGRILSQFKGAMLNHVSGIQVLSWFVLFGVLGAFSTFFYFLKDIKEKMKIKMSGWRQDSLKYRVVNFLFVKDVAPDPTIGMKRALILGSILTFYGAILNLVDVIKYHGVVDYWAIGLESPGDEFMRFGNYIVLAGILYYALRSTFVKMRQKGKSTPAQQPTLEHVERVDVELPPFQPPPPLVRPPQFLDVAIMAEI